MRRMISGFIIAVCCSAFSGEGTIDGSLVVTSNMTVQGSFNVMSNMFVNGTLTATRVMHPSGSTQEFAVVRADTLRITGASTNTQFLLNHEIPSSLGSPSDMAIQGKYAYVTYSGGGGRFAVFDLTDPSNPVEVGSTTNGPVRPNAVCIQDNLAFIADYELYSGLYIFDISLPQMPRLLSRTHSGLNRAMDVSVSGHYAYVTDKTASRPLVVFDVSDPYCPTNVGSAVREHECTGWIVEARGDVLYMGNMYAFNGPDYLLTYDISDPTTPVLTSESPVEGPTSLTFGNNGYAYLVEWYRDRIATFDMSDPLHPVPVGTTYCQDQPTDICIVGNVALVTTYIGSKMTVLDLSNPAAPAKLFDISDGIDYATSVVSYGGYVYVANDGTASISVIEAPGITGSLNADIANLEQLNVSGLAVFRDEVSVAGRLTVEGRCRFLSIEPTGDLSMGCYTNSPVAQ